MNWLGRKLFWMVIIGVFAIATISGVLRAFYPQYQLGIGHKTTVTTWKPQGAYPLLKIEQSSVSRVYERANPAVVRITATQLLAGKEKEPVPQGHPEVEQRSRGVGTGCIIDRSGYIVTNQHVIDNADQVRVQLIDNTEIPAKIIGQDKLTDLALIKVDSPVPLTVMPLGDSNRLQIGEPVVAIGNPYSYDRTVTSGIVSAKGRKVFNALYENYIQTDAAINVGNSGGPLLNLAAELIGINTVIRADANNISFAIPVNQVKSVVAQLKQQGRVVRGFFGVQPDDLTLELREALNLPSNRGAIITQVTPGSVADKAGIRVYDVIVKFNGQIIQNKDDLYQQIAEAPPGQNVEIDFIRNQSRQRVIAQLAERPTDITPPIAPKKLERSKFGRLGFMIGDEVEAKMLATSTSVTGVVVTGVDPLSEAAEVGLRRGVIITEVNRQRVTDQTSFEKAVSQVKPGQVLLLRALRQSVTSQPYFIAAFRVGQDAGLASEMPASVKKVAN